MKKSVILALVFFFFTAFTGINVKANSSLTYFSEPSSAKAVKATEEYVCHRILIGAIWWIFVYTTDGTFIIAYPDEDE